MLVIGACLFAQAGMPQKMKDSTLVVREGVLDLGQVTVGSVFADKAFIKKQALDGSPSTADYGDCSLSDDTYTLVIDLYSGQTVAAVLTYRLVYLGETTLLDRGSVENKQSGETEDATSFTDKLMMVQIFQQLVEGDASSQGG